MVYLITGAFILLDIVTGIIKAFKEKNFTSSIMREGLFHKAGSVLIVLLGVLVDYAQKFMDLGVSIPVAATFCIIIITMEIGSIIENACKINPQLLPDKFKVYFSKLAIEEKESEKDELHK